MNNMKGSFYPHGHTGEIIMEKGQASICQAPKTNTRDAELERQTWA